MTLVTVPDSESLLMLCQCLGFLVLSASITACLSKLQREATHYVRKHTSFPLFTKCHLFISSITSCSCVRGWGGWELSAVRVSASITICISVQSLVLLCLSTLNRFFSPEISPLPHCHSKASDHLHCGIFSNCPFGGEEGAEAEHSSQGEYKPVLQRRSSSLVFLVHRELFYASPPNPHLIVSWSHMLS